MKAEHGTLYLLRPYHGLCALKFDILIIIFLNRGRRGTFYYRLSLCALSGWKREKLNKSCKPDKPATPRGNNLLVSVASGTWRARGGVLR